ncbi:hypothetical protein ACHAXA_006252 [Cyclostephanos tholiformis]|uniref:HSF-type DNA-binding domain-containing protein n=1 Tax=Cyclostephanos tholiformis TaxID=382380 RepID=A0ABD3SNP6_9STRA
MPIALLAMPSSSKEHSTKSARRSNIAPSYREVRVLNPSPYFYYIDHSRGSDDDPLAPLSPALSVPNFVIKLHAILICESLSNIISWMPHGRSWKILNQTEFERQVLPTYFNQGSISSFYRQANGWGFRRLLKGPDKGSFYNERFLRGLPFLAKKMKRIGGAKIVQDININHEPILWKISAEFPTPAELSKDSLDYTVLNIINKCHKEGGPKAKMPFVHSVETGIYAKKDENEMAAAAAVSQTNLLMPQGGMINDLYLTPARSGGATISDSASVSGHDQLFSIQEGLNNTHMDAFLQQHQRLLQDQQGYNRQQEQWNLMQQLLNQDQNQLVNSLLLKLMLNETNQITTTLAPQQNVAWPQHQLQTILRNSGRFVNAYNPTAYAPVAEPLSLQGIVGNASGSLSGLQQVGDNASIPPASVGGNIYDTLRRLYLLQANEAQGQQQATLNPGTVLSRVLQNIVQTQLNQPTMRPNMFDMYPHLSQTTYSPFNLPSHSTANMLATSQSQPLHYSQQPQSNRLEQYTLPQQYQLTEPIIQQIQQMQQHDGQNQHPIQPQDEEKNQEK